MKESWIFGVHPVEAVLKSNLKVKELLLLKGIKQNKIRNILKLASSKRIPVKEVEKRSFLEEKVDFENHQGILANMQSEISYKHLEEFKDSKLIIMLDHITDPHNFGAILRSADQFCADAIIIPKNRSIEITPTVVKSSSGAAFFVPVVREGNLSQTLAKLTEWGFWSYAAAGGEGESIDKVDFAEKTLLILGNEGKGISEKLRENSDFKVHIPSNGKIDSLNVSVASAIFLYQSALKLGKI